MERRIFTSESVTEGHPDKICDQISDGILDEIMKQDPYGRVACECCCTTNFLLIMGEITTTAKVDYEKVARDIIREIGYTDESIGFDADTCEIEIRIHEQSPDIAMGVDKALEVKEGLEPEEDSNGAGDQGMMFGYATNETDELMPFPIYMSHKITRELARLRKSGELPYLRPDGKAQVSVEYDENGKPARIEAVVCSTQHSPEVTQEQLRKDIREKLFNRILPQDMIDEKTKFYINPTGQFIVGGPNGDSGLTGRKIIVDTYGGMAGHGGGAFSGKDCTKVDRSATYAARYVAKNIVAAGLAEKCEIQLSYAIGVAEPTSIMVETYGTGRVSNEELIRIIRNNFDLRPTGIIRMLNLRQPIYRQVASYGHFGRNDLDLPWEQIDSLIV
ncbi:MAG: methionine adenosyltransferase [Lachnospiraceae bacterium]|nr:methionine adenosyltransferase [Lachnospiraceae bacterium]